MKRFLVLVFALGFIFAGCAEKQAVKPEQTATQETTQKAAAPEKQAEPAAQAEPKRVETVPVTEVVETKPGVVAIENIHFDFDKYNIRDDAKPVLRGVSDWLVKNKSAKMLLEGHCDERGTNEYNLALGEKRAKSTRDYLVSSGVGKDRLEMISFGEERPLCKEQTEECWQKNRRVQFVIKNASQGSGK